MHVLLLRGGMLLSICMISVFSLSSAHGTPQHLVCVERVWCDIAQNIGGDVLSTHALLSNKGLNPHHIHPTPSIARQLSKADAVLLNGATYDDWARSFIPSTRTTFIAAHYETNWHNGDDPHLFFDPNIVTQVADAIGHWLIDKNPQQKAAITQRLLRFHQQTAQLNQHLTNLSTRFHGQAVAVTEPAGERLLFRAGLTVINTRWALSIMNENGVSPHDTALLENHIKNHHIRFLLINPAVTSPQINNLIHLAQTYSIPIIQTDETLPYGTSWVDWITAFLNQIDHTLTRSTP